MKMKLISLSMIVVVAAMSFSGCSTMTSANVQAALGPPTQVQSDVQALGTVARSRMGASSRNGVHTFAAYCLSAASLDTSAFTQHIPRTGNAEADALIQASMAFVQLAAAKYGGQNPTTLAYVRAVGQGLVNAGF